MGDAEGWRQFEEAQQLFEQKRYTDAERSFSTLARMREREHRSWRSRFSRWFTGRSSDAADIYENFGDPIEEDALFMLAESQFMQGKFASAQDSYDDLVIRYPSTRHLDQVSRRMFTIAHYWLGFPEDTLPGEVRLASVTAEVGPGLRHRDPPPALLPNLTDRTRPLFDTAGRAEQALRTIWLHDPAGPLADDALMLTANYKLQENNFTDAAYYYSLLRDQYPDSPHFQDAFLLGSHVTLATYQGPAYDGRPLREARGLKETAHHIFPNLDPEQRQILEDELARLAEAEVEREWSKVEYYLRKNQPASVALHCNYILHHHSNSIYASRARELLARLEAEGRIPSTTMIPQSGGTAATGNAPGSGNTPSGRNWWPGFLRRSEPPELSSPPQPSRSELLTPEEYWEQAPTPVPLSSSPPGRSSL